MEIVGYKDQRQESCRYVSTASPLRLWGFAGMKLRVQSKLLGVILLLGMWGLLVKLFMCCSSMLLVPHVRKN